MALSITYTSKAKGVLVTTGNIDISIDWKTDKQGKLKGINITAPSDFKIKQVMNEQPKKEYLTEEEIYGGKFK